MRFRRAGTALVAVASMAFTVPVTACGGGSGRGDASVDATAAADASVTTTITDASTTTVPSSPTSVVATGPRLVEIEDRSRAVVSGGRAISATRRLPTLVWSPADAGPHPLVVFAHGYEVGTAPYLRFCANLAAAGFVVAAPSFPLADRSRGNGLDRGDIPQEAIDVAFVIDALRSGPLAPSIGPGRVGVVGHSDGADVALLVGYGRTTVDPAVGAVVAIAPDAITGDLATTAPPPLLLVHSDSDEVVPSSDSAQVFARIGGSRTFVSLSGAPHLAPVEGSTRWTNVVDDATVLFLRATIAGGIDMASARSSMGVGGLSSVRSAG